LPALPGKMGRSGRWTSKSSSQCEKTTPAMTSPPRCPHQRLASHPATLSGGQRARVALMLPLLAKPGALLLD
jgi:ATPase subunit of ABC transporter with duplicated ATPase domains